MTRSIDFAVLDNLRDSASRGQHAHVIQETFAINNELQNLQLHLLDLRARSYVACAEFGKALDSATTMQQISPTSALGYLCQGYIHMEQGRHTAAAHLYETALEHVDKSDPLYETIITSKEKAIQQGEKRRDFIGDLPMDISARIIQALFIKERTDEAFHQQREYVTVSRAWWHRITASDHLRLIVKDMQPLEETSSIVIEAFSHVRSLVFHNAGVSFSQVLEKYRFTSLTSLTFNGIDNDAFLKALNLVGTRLTHLTYGKQAMADDPEIPLQLILKTCPDLVHLKCQTATVISGFQDTYPKLRTLELHQVRGTIDNQHTTMMKQHLPNLNILNMAIMHSLRPLTAEDTWIPAIRHLTYGDYPSGGCSQRAKFKPYEQQGLVTFSIVPGNHLFALDDIAPFIIHHHATLQLLELKCDLNTTHTVKMADTMKNNLQIEFTRLKKIAAFTISHVTNMHSYSFFLTWIVQRAPYLHEITLYGYIISEYTIRTLAKCEHLRTVLFDTGTNQRPDDYDRLVAEFVRDHVNHMADKGGSRLQILQVRLHRAAPMLIDAFRGLKSLTTFHLFTNDLASEPFVRLFESVHQGSHHLEALHIGNSGTMTNRVLYQISRNQNLRHLTISGNMSDAQAGVLSLQACRHLSHLTSYWPIDEDIQSILKEKTSCIISAPSRLD